MKYCSQCKVEKESSEFYTDKRTSDELYSSCKVCHKKRKSSLQLIKEAPTPQRVTTYMMNHVWSRVAGTKGYSHVEVRMSKDDLLRFIESNWSMYMKLYRLWKENGFDRKLSPSLDRIDSQDHYSLTNIQIITTSENCSRGGKNKKTT